MNFYVCEPRYYGYGLCGNFYNRYDDWCFGFLNEITIHKQLPSGFYNMPRFEFAKPIVWDRMEQFLHIAEENGVFREYFTGCELLNVDFKAIQKRENSDITSGEFYPGRTLMKCPIESLAFDYQTRKSASDFQKLVKSYSYEKIDSMITQVNRLIEDSATWKERFNKIVNDYLESKDLQNAQADEWLKQQLAKRRRDE